jgi:hypothetical protein
MHRLLRVLAVGLLGAALAITATSAASPDLVVSQAYVGSAGATCTSDCTELDKSRGIDAERVQLGVKPDSQGNGPTYVVSISCADPAGNASRALAPVVVPK